MIHFINSIHENSTNTQWFLILAIFTLLINHFQQTLQYLCWKWPPKHLTRTQKVSLFFFCSTVVVVADIFLFTETFQYSKNVTKYRSLQPQNF